MRRRDAERDRTRTLVDALNAIVDALRSGASLRQAFTGPAGERGSPFHLVGEALRSGRALVPTLHTTALEGGAADADVASACCVLAVHAEAGGDPLPAVRALSDRISQRQHTRDEIRALTTQARLGARTILLLTPAFLLLLGVSDPRGTIGLFADPRTRLALVAGLALQGAGAWWIGAIIANAAGASSRASRIPVLRALRAIFAGRVGSTDDDDVAWCCDIVALTLDAGLSATAAVSMSAPYARGTFGAALRDGVLHADEPLADALAASLAAIDSEAGRRFVRSIGSATQLGVPLAPTLRSLAEDIRERERLRAAEAIRKASIRVLVPLGGLVLPAFVLACLVPLFVGGLEGLTQ